MRNQTRPLLEFPIHPVFWGVYPFVSLYAANIVELPFQSAIPAFVFSIATTLSISFIVTISLIYLTTAKERKILPLVLCEILLFVITYLPTYQVIKNITFHEIIIGRHRYFMPIWIMLSIGVVTYTLKPNTLLKNLNRREIWDLAAIISSAILILFFSYGHVFNILEGKAGNQIIAYLHAALSVTWAIFLFASIWLLGKIQNKTNIMRGLNLIGGLLLAGTLIQTSVWMIQTAAKTSHPIQSPVSTASQPSSKYPDIYYIVLDGYGRSDSLREEFGINNSGFVAELKSMGFIFPECAQSNYHLTILSMTSSLNMEYLTAFPPGTDQDSLYVDFEPYLQNNRVFDYFENLGYETYAFAGINPYTEIPSATHFITTSGSMDNSTDIAALNFYYLYLQTTALRPALDYLETGPDLNAPVAEMISKVIPRNVNTLNRHYLRYQQNVYHLNVLEGIPDLPGRKLVYAHLYMAHEPFVFTPEGDFRQSLSQDDEAYKEQILFLNNRIPRILRKILDSSPNPPIIIVQADHGWSWNKRRNQILNAYYLPGDGKKEIYPQITPVNTFRLVINQYFGGNYKLLPDISYNAPYADFHTKNLKVAPTTCVPHTP